MTMPQKRSIIGLIVAVIVIFLFALTTLTIKPQYFNLPSCLIENDKIVLLTCMGRTSGGMERCVLTQHKLLLQLGVKSILITNYDGYIGQQARDQKLPVCLCSSAGISAGTWSFFPSIAAAGKNLIKRYEKNLLAVHCNKRREVFVLHPVAAKNHVPIFFSEHNPGRTHKGLRLKSDCIIGVSKNVKETIDLHNAQDGIKGAVIALPPLFEIQKFLDFTPTESREAFFTEKFGITLKPIPLISMIAHFAPDKNHPLLFLAMHDLIYRKGKPVQAVLAGGSEKNVLTKYKRMIKDLNLNEYVYMIGPTELTPALLYYADMNTLPSLRETFGMALAEGGLMKKPSIAAKGIGSADWLIINNETGFIFENNNPQALADCIEKVLDNPELAARCGQALYEKVMTEFHPEQTIRNLIALYEQAHEKKRE